MTKKTAALPDTRISITLPAVGGIVRTGTITAQRGDLAVFASFEYAGQGDIADAIYDVLVKLIDVEAAPPPDIQTRPSDEYKPAPVAPVEQSNGDDQGDAGETESAPDPALQKTQPRSTNERPPTDVTPRSPTGETAQLSMF